jgi:hypothetical protein
MHAHACMLSNVVLLERHLIYHPHHHHHHHHHHTRNVSVAPQDTFSRHHTMRDHFCICVRYDKVSNMVVYSFPLGVPEAFLSHAS